MKNGILVGWLDGGQQANECCQDGRMAALLLVVRRNALSLTNSFGDGADALLNASRVFRARKGKMIALVVGMAVGTTHGEGNEGKDAEQKLKSRRHNTCFVRTDEEDEEEEGTDER